MEIDLNRRIWLNGQLKKNEKRMDEVWAPNYDSNWGEIEKTHMEMIRKLVSYLSKKPYILDAACGTGKYWQILKELHCHTKGVDISKEMLKAANKKHPDVEVEHINLYNINFKEEFEAIICVDSMECVFPEYWPIILKNFYNTLKNKGYIYITVEVIEEKELKENFDKCRNKGLPVVFGEFLMEECGYHYYPKLSEVRNWINRANFTIVEENESEYYHHFLFKRNF